METEIDDGLLHDHVKDAVVDWEQPFDPHHVVFCGDIHGPRNYNYVVENLVWW